VVAKALIVSAISRCLGAEFAVRKGPGGPFLIYDSNQSFALVAALLRRKIFCKRLIKLRMLVRSNHLLKDIRSVESPLRSELIA